VEDITDFIENALYDPAFVKFDPNSTTRTHESSYTREKVVQYKGGPDPGRP
jgi:hypothetical protein